MKTSIPITAILLVSTFGVLAQGTIQMNGRSGTLVQAQVFGLYANESKQGNTAANYPAGTQTYDGVLLTGSGYYAQLWWGMPGTLEDGLLPVAGSLTTFRTGTFAGFWAAPASVVTIPGVYIGNVTLQVRAWVNDGGTITSYDDAVYKGRSAVFQAYLAHPAPSPVLENVRSFGFYVPGIPEPSTYALLSLGGLGLWLFRRKQPTV